MSSQSQETRTPGKDSKLLRSYADFLRYVGALDGDRTWRWSDGADSHEPALRKFRQSTVVEIEHYPRGGGRKAIEEYRLTDTAREYVVDYLDTRETLCPCGHAGIQNHGDYYACAFEPCQQRFDRSEVDA